jgi:hypothetical protein
MAIYTFSQISSYSAKSRPPNSEQCVGTRWLSTTTISRTQRDRFGRLPSMPIRRTCATFTVVLPSSESSFSSSHPSSPCSGCWARLAMPRDPYIREKFTRDLSFARQLAREYFQRYPKERYETEVESWWIQSQNVEFRPRRRRQSAPKFDPDGGLNEHHPETYGAGSRGSS